MVRDLQVFISSANDPDYAANYYVTAYEVGAIVSAGSASTTVTVDAGHGFANSDKLIVFNSTNPANVSTYRTVSGVGATSFTVNSSLSLSVGDILVNLGPDTGGVSPLFDGSGAPVYTDMDYSLVAVASTIQLNSEGRGRYYHKGIARWELIRSSATVISALYMDAGGTVGGADTSTDNAVARWDGTTGENLQNSVVLISDTGVITGVVDLTMTGALSVTGNVTVFGSASIGSALTAVTLGVTGPTTLTGGVAGGIPRNIGTTDSPIFQVAGAPAVGSNTVVTPGSAFVASVFVPRNCTVTGIQFLIGATGSANSVIVSLHNQTGTLLANSLAAGTAVSTANTLQQVAFTGTYAAVGPAHYFIALTFNGSTATIRTIPTGNNAGSGIVCGKATQTFGTPATFTAPTTFTADTAPIASLY